MVSRQEQRDLMAPAQLAQRCIATDSGGLLDAIALTIDQGNLARIEMNPESDAFAFTMQEPCIRIRTQAMMDVKRKQSDAMLARICVRKMQQGCRVEAAAIGDREPLLCRVADTRRNRNARPDHSQRAFESVLHRR